MIDEAVLDPKVICKAMELFWKDCGHTPEGLAVSTALFIKTLHKEFHKGYE